MAGDKTDPGRFFEDFRLGETLAHATPRTLNAGDQALYTALYGGRHALYSSAPFARACGLAEAPLDPLLVFHTVFGKTVPDISLNAVANLGYAEGRFLRPVAAGETLRATSEVIGLKETSNRKTGVVYVRTTGLSGIESVLSYVRWVLVRKRDEDALAPGEHVPTLQPAVEAADLVLSAGLNFSGYDLAAAGGPHRCGDYAIGEKIDHVDGMAVEEAEAQLATRLYQNTAKVHFNQFERSKDPSGRRLVYGGVLISTARSLAFNGLQNAGMMLAINGGRHVNPYFAGGTVFAWSEVLDRAELSDSVGALRLRLVATADRPCSDFPDKGADGAYPREVLLDFDYWAAISAMSGFTLHPDFEPTSHPVGELDLCAVRLQSDARWPWLILIPRQDGIGEIEHLSPADRGRLMEEQVLAASAVRAMGEALLRPIAKLNIAALGNVTPQLHVHVIGRRRDDPAWPAPVWGVGQAAPYSEGSLVVAMAAARDALGL